MQRDLRYRNGTLYRRKYSWALGYGNHTLDFQALLTDMTDAEDSQAAQPKTEVSVFVSCGSCLDKGASVEIGMDIWPFHYGDPDNMLDGKPIFGGCSPMACSRRWLAP